MCIFKKNSIEFVLAWKKANYIAVLARKQVNPLFWPDAGQPHGSGMCLNPFNPTRPFLAPKWIILFNKWLYFFIV